eukprot:scaffold85786_cov63-Phaeocystis_antarctica.AAC.1
MASAFAKAVLAFALLVACAGLRVLPQAPVRLLAPPAASCAVAMLEANKIASDDENYRTTAEERRSWQKNEIEGVGPGGWDNDEYLAETKANAPEPADSETLLRQAYAYRDMLKEKGLGQRRDVEEMIAELEAGASPETLAAIEQSVSDVPEWRPSQMRRPSDLPNSPPPPPSLQQLFGPKPTDEQGATPAPVTVTSEGGVSSSNSYAAMMAQAGAPAAAPSVSAMTP